MEENRKEIKLEDVFNDEKRENIKKFIDEIKNPSEPNQALKDAAERLKDKELFKESNDRARKTLSEIKSLPIQERYEKYSERFDNDKSAIGNSDTWGNRWVVIIPKEEPNIIDQWLEKNGNPEIAKQVELEAEELYGETLEEVAKKLKGKELFKESNDRARETLSEIKSLPTQKTLEEVAERLVNRPYGNVVSKSSFIAGAKWQAERMYSEEDMREAFRQGENNVSYNSKYGYTFKLTEKEWFEQFKKK